MKKLFSVLILTAMTAGFIFANSGSYIRITSYDDESYVYSYNPSLDGEKYCFKGAVSPDCVSVRCIWSGTSHDAIVDYILNGSKKTSGIDDFVLTKYIPGSTEFEYFAGGKLDNLQWGSNYYLFIAKFKDGTYKSTRRTFFVHQGGMAEKGKPVIYLYPLKKTDVSVKVEPKGGVTVSIPEYKKGWKVTAEPDGKITDKKTKKEYPYLFWESNDYTGAVDTAEGFVVKTSELESFFDEKLCILGLNEKEISDFKEFWIPEINKEEKPFTFITFYSQEKINKEVPLTISPKPDSVIRVYFDHLGLDEIIETAEQNLTPVQRSGFSVVEWGGRKYK